MGLRIILVLYILLQGCVDYGVLTKPLFGYPKAGCYEQREDNSYYQVTCEGKDRNWFRREMDKSREPFQEEPMVWG